jgi:two-component system OmpR family response regulator
MSDTLLNPTDAKSKIVLGVDDAPDNLSLLKLAVESAGYTFVGARSGVECLPLIGKMMPKFILLDIEMQNMDGFETCRRIRRLPGAGGIPVAFLTARKTAEDVKIGVAAGGNDFIVKPYDVVKLIERVNYWVNRSAPTAAPAWGV